MREFFNPGFLERQRKDFGVLDVEPQHGFSGRQLIDGVFLPRSRGSRRRLGNGRF